MQPFNNENGKPILSNIFMSQNKPKCSKWKIHKSIVIDIYVYIVIINPIITPTKRKYKARSNKYYW